MWSVLSAVCIIKKYRIQPSIRFNYSINIQDGEDIKLGSGVVFYLYLFLSECIS